MKNISLKVRFVVLALLSTFAVALFAPAPQATAAASQSAVTYQFPGDDDYAPQVNWNSGPQ